MRSYQAARRCFSILEFLAWCLILIGGFVVIAALVAVAETNQQFGGTPAFMIFISTGLPGGGVAFAGLLGLVLAQMGRAGVDSAEYGQQSLKISRDQLEISKQLLRMRSQAEPGYAALQAAKNDLRPNTPAKVGDVPKASYAAPTSEAIKLAPPTNDAIEYKGKAILPENDRFVVGHIKFHSLEEAQQFIDHQTDNSKPVLTGVTRS